MDGMARAFSIREAKAMEKSITSSANSAGSPIPKQEIFLKKCLKMNQNAFYHSRIFK